MTIGYKNPPPRRRTDIPSTAKNTNYFHLADQYRHGLSWDAIGTKIGVPGVSVYRAVVKGKLPKSASQRRALAAGYDEWKARNLPALLAIVEWAETPPGERKWLAD
jgi:hypothetical protein